MMLASVASEASAGDLYICKPDANGHKFEIDLRACEKIDSTGFVCKQTNQFYYVDVSNNSFYIKYPLSETSPKMDIVDNIEVGYCTARE
jgi:hypothetical protein